MVAVLRPAGTIEVSFWKIDIVPSGSVSAGQRAATCGDGQPLVRHPARRRGSSV